MSEPNLSANPPAEPREELGQRLRSARELRGLDRDELAQRLKLRPDIVDAVERGNYASLGAPVFVRGYLRSYAAAMELSPALIQPVIESLGEAPKLGPSPASIPRNPWIERYSLAGSYLVGTVLIMSVIWAAVQTDGFGLVARLGEPPSPLDLRVPDSAEEAADVVVSGPLLPATDHTATDGFETPAAQELAAPAPAPTAPLGAAPVVTTPVPPVRSAPVMASLVPALDRGEGRFSIRVSADTWLEIRDASGKRIKYDIQKAGEQEYRGQPPFELRIGNAGKAELLVEGRSIDLAPFSRREIARLRLVAAGGALSAEELPRASDARSAAPGSGER